MERNAPIRATFASEDETPLRVVQAKAARDDLTLGAEDGSLGAIANPRRTRADAGLPKPPPGPPPAARGRRPPIAPVREEPEDDDGWSDGDEGDDEDGGDDGSGDDGFADPFEQRVDDEMVAQAEKMRAEKMDIINKLHRHVQRGVDVPSHLTIRTPLDELRSELGKVEHDLHVRNAIRQQRRMLMGLVSGLQWMTTDIVPDMGIELEGWDKSVLSTIDEYDGVFEELYDLYGSKLKMHPLIKLVYMVGTSAAMYHCTTSMMKHHQQQKPASQVDKEAAAEYLRNLSRQYAQEDRRQEERSREQTPARAEASDVPPHNRKRDMVHGALHPDRVLGTAAGSFGTMSAAIARDTAKMPLDKGGSSLGLLSGLDTHIPQTPPPVSVPAREGEYRMRPPAMTMGQPVGVRAAVGAADAGGSGGTPDLSEIRPDLGPSASSEAFGQLPPILEGAADGETASTTSKRAPAKRGARKKKDEGDGVGF